MYNPLFSVVYGVIFLLMFAQHQKDDFLSLKRTACYGPCPVFEVTVWSSGKVAFLGESFVSTIGRKEYWVNKDSVKRLLILARRLKFFSMPKGFYGDPIIHQLANGRAETTYTGGTDNPGRFITVRVGDTTKTVQDDWGVSLEIAEL